MAGTSETLITRLETMYQIGCNTTHLKAKVIDEGMSSECADEMQTETTPVKRNKLTEKEKASLWVEIDELLSYHSLAR